MGTKSSSAATKTECFPLLADAEGYVPCVWDLLADSDKRTYWLAIFRRHFPMLLEEAVQEAIDRSEDEDVVRERAIRCGDMFYALLEDIANDPGCMNRLDILVIDAEHDRVLKAYGFHDPYRLAKQHENESSLTLLPKLLAELDALSPIQRRRRVMEGVLAGNIFDLGAPKTVKLLKDGGGGFHETRESLAPRPWLVDDLDPWLDRVSLQPSYRCAVLFVDNAGPDVVLGMIPFARDLLQHGSKVILTANNEPSLNDITHDELVSVIDKVAQWDETIAQSLIDHRLQLIASGNAFPLIDLSMVSVELARAVVREDVDLVVLEGMGRAIESNYDARFTCDALKIALIKDQGVADAMGGRLYDLVVRFEPAC